MISHPFIIKLYSTFQNAYYVFMLLEYVCGGELFSRLRKEGRFSNDVALFYITEIVTAFEYLHSMDIAYRDLKPENLLIDKDGHIKITDFGFAKVVKNKTQTLCGTPEYLAPEIIQNQGHDKTADWWALGILLFEMLSGYPPFYDDNPLGIYKRIIEGYYEIPQFIRPRARDLIKRLLTADRSIRLGCSERGAEEVKEHKWFIGVDWVMVTNKEIPTPWKPDIKSSIDTHYFDKYPDSQSPANTPPQEEQDYFKDF